MANAPDINVPGGGVAVIGGPGAQVRAPVTNGALQLADALRQASPHVNQFISDLGSELRAKDEAKATAAALKTTQAGYAQAVASGEIAGGQSPWFVQKFNQDRAQVSAQTQTTAKVQESQSWAERAYTDGGAAYEARLNKELGAIKDGISATPGMHPLDAEQGFQAGATPVARAAIAETNAYQLKAMATQKIQDSSQLIEDTIIQARAANPLLSAKDVMAQLEPQFQQLEAVGFTKSDIAKLAFHSFAGVAYQQGDGSLIHDLSNTPFRGAGQPLSLIADENGHSYGEQIADAVYRIQRDSDYKDAQLRKDEQTRLYAMGNKAATLIKGNFGWGLVDGSVPMAQIQEFAKANNISPEAFAEAAHQMHTELESVANLSGDTIKLAATNPGVNKDILDLTTEAVTKGISPNLISRARKMSATGEINDAQFNQIIDHAQARTNTLISQGNTQQAEDRADARQAKQQAADDRKQLVTFADDAMNGAIHLMLNPPPPPPGVPAAKPDNSWKNPKNIALLKERLKGVYGQGILLEKSTADIQKDIQAELGLVMQQRRNVITAPPGGNGGKPSLNPLGGR